MTLNSLVNNEPIKELPTERRRAYVCFALISQIGKDKLTVGEIVKIVNNVTFQSFTPYQIMSDINFLKTLHAVSFETKSYPSGRKIVRHFANSCTILMMGVYYQAMSKTMREMAASYVVDCDAAASEVYEGVYRRNVHMSPSHAHLDQKGKK